MRPDFRLSTLLPALLAVTFIPAVAAPTPDQPGTPPAAGASASGTARQQPIQIEANRAEITEQSGVSIYSGRVNLKQGDLEMEGERLEIRRDGKTGDIHALLTGKPALLRQPSEAGEMVNARAERIDYRSREKTIDLQGGAEFTRGRDRVSGQNIRYDANTKQLLATGPNRDGERVQIIIQPEQQGQTP